MTPGYKTRASRETEAADVHVLVSGQRSTLSENIRRRGDLLSRALDRHGGPPPLLPLAASVTKADRQNRSLRCHLCLASALGSLFNTVRAGLAHLSSSRAGTTRAGSDSPARTLAHEPEVANASRSVLSGKQLRKRWRASDEAPRRRRTGPRCASRERDAGTIRERFGLLFSWLPSNSPISLLILLRHFVPHAIRPLACLLPPVDTSAVFSRPFLSAGQTRSGLPRCKPLLHHVQDTVLRDVEDEARTM
jgi:hypothetical protein